MANRKQTTILMDDDVLRAIQLIAIYENKTQSDVVCQTLRDSGILEQGRQALKAMAIEAEA